MSNYIGTKGYTILKTKLSLDDENKIKKELFVKPFIPKVMNQKVKSFPVYHESTTKYYLPKFYGLDTFGKAESKINKYQVVNENIDFKGSLRDYQEEIVTKFINHTENNDGGLLEIDTGMGKTVMALNILSKLKVKTIIIVHKEFLMNQWIERIKEFIPNAKIGKLQGKTLELENDIVIAMLQSLCIKDFPQDMFQQFGLTIIDEVHHMGAEVFSQALSKVITKYTLGLSATMNRKDGLSKVFKMFLGDVVHQQKRDIKSASVIIKTVNYDHLSEEYSKVKYDFRGNVQYSSMITKICSFEERSKFIIQLIIELLKTETNEQIMILAHNKNLLTYLYENLKDDYEIGYYVGGMKEEELKKSEEKKLIVATYSMASEGLDIKTLTTLILATPKTDIVQSVGRILRQKHEQPLVVDIIDSHEIFKRQYKQRAKFYNQQNYKILNADFENALKSNYTEVSKKKISKNVDDINPELNGKCLI